METIGSQKSNRRKYKTKNTHQKCRRRIDSLGYQFSKIYRRRIKMLFSLWRRMIENIFFSEELLCIYQEIYYQVGFVSSRFEFGIGTRRGEGDLRNRAPVEGRPCWESKQLMFNRVSPLKCLTVYFCSNPINFLQIAFIQIGNMPFLIFTIVFDELPSYRWNFHPLIIYFTSSKYFSDSDMISLLNLSDKFPNCPNHSLAISSHVNRYYAPSRLLAMDVDIFLTSSLLTIFHGGHLFLLEFIFGCAEWGFESVLFFVLLESHRL